MRHLPSISLCLNWHHICWSKILLHAFANTESQNAVPWGTNTKNYRPVHTTTSAEFLQHRHKPPANSFPSLCIPLLLLQISSHATLSSSWAIIKTHSSITGESLWVSYNVKHAIKIKSTTAWLNNLNYLEKDKHGLKILCTQVTVLCLAYSFTHLLMFLTPTP